MLKLLPGLYVLALLLLTTTATAQFGMAGPKVEHKPYTRTDAVAPGQSLDIAFTFTLDETWHVNSNKPLEDFLIPTELTFEENPAYTVEEIAYPKAEDIKLEFSETPLAVYGTEFAIGARLKFSDSAAPGEQVLKARLRYQACNDKQCAPPKNLDLELPVKIVAAGAPVQSQHDEIFKDITFGGSANTAPAEAPADAAPAASSAAVHKEGDWQALASDFTVAARLGGFEDTEGFLGFVDVAEGKAEADRGLEGLGWFGILFAVLAGGLALNLTPCVLPLIPINIAIIGAGASAGSKGRGFALGGAYGVGIALVYGALGLVVVLGISSAFGTINSTVWFNAAIAAFFVVLALGMFDIIHIDFSKFQAQVGIRKNENGSFMIAFGMGAISALLAGACVAPVLISTLLYAQDQFSRGNTLALALPFLLGIGMALPWPFAGAGMSFLPKPGVWMNRVKYAFGLFILVVGAWYAHAAYDIWDSKNANPDEVLASVKDADDAGWLHSITDGMAAAKEQNKPLLVDFWATWCKNCLVMNETVLKDETVKARLEDYVKVKYQAEDPTDPATAAVMEHFEVLGLPTYLVLKPR